MQDLKPFFEEQHFIERHDTRYEPLQWGANISFASDENFDWDAADIVIIGCGECRGATHNAPYSIAPDLVRKQLYNQYNWHPNVKIADAGNIRQGSSVDDTRAALRMVLAELLDAGKNVIILGGSHDLMMQQYDVFRNRSQGVVASAVDMLIDLDESEKLTDKSFLMEMLTGQPNYLLHYNHMAFQSYYVHPRMLETLDKLRFDFFRLGKVREHIDEMEPALRGSHIFGFDMNAIRYSDAPANKAFSPNGLSGEDACALTRYAGMSNKLHSIGIYGYDPTQDDQEMTAKLIAQMIWYYIDGYQVRKVEPSIEERDAFLEFHVSFTSNDTVFLKSKRSGRWWMELPGGGFIPCSYYDYQQACNDEIPERWLREQERLM